MNAQKGSSCIAQPFKISARWGMGGQCHTLATLHLEETHYLLCRRLGGPQGQSVWVQKVSPLLGFDPWIFEPVTSCYTN
jgi:hypothetical protein